VKFRRTTDYELVRQILTANARSYDAMCEDGSPRREEFRPIEHPAIWYVVAGSDAGVVYGLFMFVPQNAICYEVHNCFLPRAWGRQALEAGRGASGWMFANSPCRRIVGATPAYLRLALAFAKRSGMVEYGINPKAFLKNGVLHDLILTGISP
jgi:hypothetical protein